MKFIRFPFSYQYLAIFAFLAVFLTGCNIVKKESKAPTLLKTENASQASLMDEVNRFARVNSIRAKMDLRFEDNSYAQFGLKEAYRTTDGEIVVQRPANILLKVQIPLIKSDIAQMTSDGTKFRVAILNDGGSGQYKKFVLGTNSADYSELRKDLNQADLDNSKKLKQNVNAFADIRPQHFTEAMLVRPIDPANAYTISAISQIEDDDTQPAKSPLRRVMRGYYLLDEYAKNSDGNLKILRRFWFDRVGGIRLARQQIFDSAGEIDSDIVYGKQGNLTDTGEYNNLPLEIQVTRPKERYSMKLTYQAPEAVTIGKTYPEKAFVLENTWGLEEVDLDKKLQEVRAQRPTGNTGNNQNSATRFH